MIPNRFLLYKTKEAFYRERHDIRDDSIVFIEGETPIDRAIWTNGKFYSSTLGLEHSKGLFNSYDSLKKSYMYPVSGDWAIVVDDWTFGKQFPITLGDENETWSIYVCEIDGTWKRTDLVYNNEKIKLSEYVRKEDINLNQYASKDDIDSIARNYLTKEDARVIYETKEDFEDRIEETNSLIQDKQDLLVSGVNISTINGKSLLTGENIQIQSTIVNTTTGQSIDVSDFVTKNELQNYAKKQDIQNLAKTSDLDSYIKIENINSYIPSPIDTSGFATKSELEDYVQKAVLKTINGESLIGTGNIEIQAQGSTDMTGYITKEEFDNYNKLLSVNITSITPTVFEYTGDPATITCQYVVKKGADTVIPATLTVNGNNIPAQSSGTFTISHNTLGTKQITLVATLGSEVASITKTSTSVRPTYLGFSTESNASDLDLSNFIKVIQGSISMRRTLDNSVAGSYLWIITQFNIQKVAVDENFTYTVSMDNPITINGLKYYRSKQQIDKCELTYYIK